MSATATAKQEADSVLSASALACAPSARLPEVLNAGDLWFARGSLVALLGANGAGKSSLLATLAGLVPPVRGHISLGAIPFARLSRRTRARTLSYLPQDGRTAWGLSVRAVVTLGRLPHREPWAGLSPADEAAIERAMAATDIRHLADRPVTALSGGERARVLFARALAGDPVVLLADEPIAGLDPAHRLDMMSLLAERAASGALVIAALHDLALAVRFASRAIVLAGGRIIADGTPEAVLDDTTLAQAFDVRAVRTLHDGVPILVPWARANLPDAKQGRQ